VGTTSSGKRRVYLTLDGVPEEIMLETLDSYQPAAGGKRGKARAPGHITTAMPGNIVDVLVKVDQVVKAGTAVLITEAMKMETEIQAPVGGKVVAIHVKKGDRVTPGEILLEIN
jgi:pyruvate carboxylase subunit B